MINMVVAYGANRELGTNGDLPWKRGLPTDMTYFKQLTSGGSVIMGRKTYESIPARFRPLEDRENIVVSRNHDLFYEGALCVGSLIKAIDSAKLSPCFIIGGGQLYAEGLALTDRIYATEVKQVFDEADTFFPELESKEWIETSRTRSDRTEAGDLYPFDFVVYDRIKKAP